jgi:hypothetical protein
MIPFHSDLPFESRSYSILTQNLDHLLGIRQGCNVRKARNDAFGLRGTRIKNEWGPVVRSELMVVSLRRNLGTETILVVVGPDANE